MPLLLGYFCLGDLLRLLQRHHLRGGFCIFKKGSQWGQAELREINGLFFTCVKETCTNSTFIELGINGSTYPQ